MGDNVPTVANGKLTQRESVDHLGQRILNCTGALSQWNSAAAWMHRDHFALSSCHFADSEREPTCRISRPGTSVEACTVNLPIGSAPWMRHYVQELGPAAVADPSSCGH